MKISKTTQSLMLISFVAVVFDVARPNIWGAPDLLYLVWNLFLAWIPYIISSCFIKKDTPFNNFIPLFILWLLFFPNAPYLVTDILHIASGPSSLLWYDSLLFFFFGWIGLLVGMLSLFHIRQYAKVRVTYAVSELIILAICFISSFGIYLGRFERWNSWDIFINPLELIRHSFYISTNLAHTRTPLVFVVVFTIFMYSVYKTVYVIIGSEVESN